MFLAGEMLESEKPIFKISPMGVFFGGLCASGWGIVIFFENVLLAGEMLKSAKPIFNISPVGTFLGGYVLLAGEMLFFVF